MTARYELISGLLGKPWVANANGPDAYDCFHLTQYVLRELWHRELSDVVVPNELRWDTVVKMISESAEFQRWQEVPAPQGFLHRVVDGAIVLMARGHWAAHLGVWFLYERSVLHTDNPGGVRFDKLMDLQAMGWKTLRFYVPK